MKIVNKFNVASIGLVAAVAIVNLWIVSAGRLVNWPEYGQYYGMLADGFLHGQTSLLARPSAELMALPNPYDPATNRPFVLYDALLFEGKYYIYWGPVPALIAAVAKLCGAAHVGDQHLAYFLQLGALICSAVLIHRCWRRRFADQPYWIAALGILVAGLGMPMPFLLARASVYEAAIMGGQFFLLAGVYFALSAFDSPKATAWRLALAGACWGCAMGSRISLMPFMFVLACAVVMQLLRRREPIHRAAYLLLPLACAPVGLALYNHARFGSLTETGIQYQLGSDNNDQSNRYNSKFSPRYVPANALNYLAAPLSYEKQFPFLRSRWGLPRFRGEGAPRFYRVHVISGLLITTPFALLAVVPLLLRLREWKQVRSDVVEHILWIAAMAAALGPILLFFYCTTRYLGDFAPLMAIFATIGAWQLRVATAGRLRLRWIFTILIVTVTVWTCGAGVLLAITGESDHFHRNNPELFKKLSRLSI